MITWSWGLPGGLKYKGPLALADAVADGRLKKGARVLLTSVGAGFTAGAVLLRWAY